MKDTPNDLLMRACKLQMETAAGVIEALAQSAKRMAEAQMKGDSMELWRLQNEWASKSMEKSLAYWRDCWEIALAAQTSIASQLSEQMQVPGIPAAKAGGQVALLEMIDSAYKRWLESTRQFYSAPAVSAPQVRQTT